MSKALARLRGKLNGSKKPDALTVAEWKFFRDSVIDSAIMGYTKIDPKYAFLIQARLGDELITETPIGHFPTLIEGIPDGLRSAAASALRNIYIAKYGWAIPNSAAIKAIVSFMGKDTLLSVGSGKAYWESLIAAELGDKNRVICTDINPGDGDVDIGPDYSEEGLPSYGMEVTKMNSATAVLTYTDCNVLFTCWPCFCRSAGFSAIRRFKGDKVVYIGEIRGGCTGDAAFHQNLLRNWDLVERIEIPSWQGIHDSCWLYARKKRMT